MQTVESKLIDDLGKMFRGLNGVKKTRLKLKLKADSKKETFNPPDQLSTIS
jgi:hypothetical protein